MGNIICCFLLSYNQSFIFGYSILRVPSSSLAHLEVLGPSPAPSRLIKNCMALQQAGNAR